MKADLRHQEILARIFLFHRFGLTRTKTQLDNEIINVENLDFHVAFAEFRRSYKIFIESKEIQEKIYHLITQSLASKHYRIPEKDASILIHKISATLLNTDLENNGAHQHEQLAKRNIVIVPIKTFYTENNGSSTSHEHIKAITLFEDRLLKINPRDINKNPTVRIYRIQKYILSDMEALLDSFKASFTTPLDHHGWDKTLNAITNAEKISSITKKEQRVGNGSWLTAKMFILTVVYGTLFQYCRSNDLKDFDTESLCAHIAEGIYKLFIVDDRNRAVSEYLEMHGYHEPLAKGEPLSVKHRLGSIKSFLAKPIDKLFPADKVMLGAIYIKSLNWLLADYLKKGDIGEAHALIEAEENNHHWNPLIYAAKNGKIVIAELLGSNQHYITLKDDVGNLPIHYAVLNGHEDMLRVFLRYKKKNKLDLTAKNNEGNPPLHLAVLHNQFDIIELLLKHEPELLNIKNDHNETALKLSCDLQNINIIQWLLSKGASQEGINPKEYPENIQKLLLKTGHSALH